ncbi:hypothetical protein RAA17_12890 [Komagataeibacter rhaeticus]|nr:hypothetical protein [Komagataeibacter rhaeticus]
MSMKYHAGCAAEGPEFDGVTQFSMNMYQYYLNMVYRHDWDAAYALPKNILMPWMWKKGRERQPERGALQHARNRPDCRHRA